ncbi:hypothetical protein TWF506_002904 [Arthrobotrys conoides]|uniref:Uncharacterized protein n=1 Tax=Arthrobotrys conoides TaxID=74498 RepID=A0AAN8NMC9_9PEZI
MLFNSKSVVLALLAVGATASPYPAAKSNYCKSKCSPGQLDDVFNAPSYLPDTKDWCRKYLHLPATLWVTQTKTTYVTNYYKHTATITKTYTAAPVTITNTDFETTTVTDQEVSTTVETDFTTVVETSTSLITVVNEVTQTEEVTLTDEATATTVITNVEVVTQTNTIVATATVTKFIPKPYYKPYQKREDFKIPSYLPQDMSPDQIGSHCKKLNPCTTKTTVVTKTITIPSYKTTTVFTWVTVTPTETAVVTTVATNVETITVPETTTTTVVELSTVTIDSTAATVTNVVSTETDIIATTTVIVETNTITESTVETATTATTLTVTTTKIAFCKKEPEYCDLQHPEACCSGHCVKVFKTPVCCVLKGADCDPKNPEGCCSGKCKAQGFSYGKPVYKCY